jgi:hypothetical protein
MKKKTTSKATPKAKKSVTRDLTPLAEKTRGVKAGLRSLRSRKRS